MIWELDGEAPEIDPTAWIAPGAPRCAMRTASSSAIGRAAALSDASVPGGATSPAATGGCDAETCAAGGCTAAGGTCWAKRSIEGRERTRPRDGMRLTVSVPQRTSRAERLAPA